MQRSLIELHVFFFFYCGKVASDGPYMLEIDLCDSVTHALASM